MRVTASGSWTNEGPVSANITVVAFAESVPNTTTQGTISHHQQIEIPVNIPPGVHVAEFWLGFRNDWGTYPTSDIDMVVKDPNSKEYRQGAGLNSPEQATIVDPPAGRWTVTITGFDIPAGWDKYELRIAVDGNVIK
jgi:hypothetical protein